MPIYGSLKTMDMGDILQWIYLRNKTGVLTVKIGEYERRFFLSQGRLKYGISDDPEERLGPYLNKTLGISRDDILKAIALSKKEKILLGEAIVKLGFASEEQVRKALENLVREITFNSFVEEGYFRFEEKEMEVPYEVDIDIQDLLLAGYARKDETEAILKVIPSMDVEIRVIREADDPLVGELSSGASLKEAAERLGLSSFEAMKRAYELVEEGYIEVFEKKEGKRPERDLFINLKEKADFFYREGRLMEAEEIYKTLLEEDPGNQEILLRLEELKKALSVDLSPLAIPRIKIPMGELTSLELTPQEGFVLSRINGTWSVQEIGKLCPFPPQTTEGILKILAARGIIGFE